MSQNQSNGKYVYRDMTLTTDPGGSGTINAALDVATVSVEDLDDVTVFLHQVTDAGAVSLVVDYSPDGTNWVPAVATKSEADFGAGAHASIAAYTLSDTHGMPLVAKQVRVTAASLSGGGVYGAGVTGRQTANFR